MAKKTQIPMTGGSTVTSKLVGTAVAVGLVAFIVKQPVEAAHGIGAGFNALGDVPAVLVTFLQQVGG